MKKQSDKPKGNKSKAEGEPLKSRKGIGGPKPKPEEQKTKYAVGSYYLTKAEKELYDRVFEQSGIKSQTKFFRKHFFGGGLKLYYSDKNTSLIYEKLSDIENEIQRIGINFNQVTARVHTHTSEKNIFSSLNELTILIRKVEQEMKGMLGLVNTLIEHSDQVREEEIRQEGKMKEDIKL